ncbi:hypothetical protein E2C01_085346 [Portunus trituberculatus]|uniref:Uncharacterized protein n=1 Tax=Portunus trituberculatus TaxID=210409 RepID=A0A5B7J6L2_PORTR|nr:hypothetical protein [Portunus trituberculatus]
MSSKWPATPSAGEWKAKKTRKSLSSEIKLQEEGGGASFITRTLQVPQSTVSTVIKQATNVKKAGENFYINGKDANE